MAKTYDLKNVVLTIGGVPIKGFGDDAIEPEWTSELVEGKSLADGGMVYSRLNNRELIVNIHLTQHSLAYTLLAGLLEVQHGDVLGVAPPVILPLPFAMIDPSNGDSILSGDTVFMARPVPAKGRTAGEVTFRVSLPSPKVVYGAANTP